MQTPSLQNLLEAGVHFGHKVSRSNPRMKPFIYGVKDGVNIINLELSEKYLKEAGKAAFDLGKSGGTLLFIGTKKQAQEKVAEAAKSVEAPYLTFRFVGGFLTNFEEISKNIKKLKDLKEAKQKGELLKYTKKEQLLLDRKISDLEKIFSGVLDLEKLPDAIFVVDCEKDHLAIKEAQRTGVKVIAVVDSNADPSLVDFPIPGNDDAIKSITILVDTITKAFKEGKEEAGKLAAKASASAKALADKEEKVEELPEEVVLEVAEAEEKVEKKALEESERK